MSRFFLNARNKWLLGIGAVAIVAGVTAKSVISYPTECLPGKHSEISYLISS